MTELFADRAAAGAALAEVLAPALPRWTAPGTPGTDEPTPVHLLALPRGGVPVAAVVADRLGLALDVLVVRKVGMPGRPELALGALGSGGALWLDARLIARLGVPPERVDAVVQAETAELARREAAYRAGRPAPDLTGSVAVLIDDGLATGASMRAAALAVRSQAPLLVVAAAPVGPPGVADRLGDVCDEVVLVRTPAGFASVGGYYADFSQTTDEQVRAALAAARPD